MAAPAPPYLGPAKFHGSATNKPIRRIVIHGTVSPCRVGQARIVARYFKSTVTRPSSAHYVVDPHEAVQVVYDSVVAYHAPPNAHALGIELCDPVSGPASRWRDQAHTDMLQEAAFLVAGLCRFYAIPIVKLGSNMVRANAKGICGHIDVSNAFHQTSHTDPGPDFPWSRFIDLVKAQGKSPAKASVKKAAVAPPTPKDWFDMATRAELTGVVNAAVSAAIPRIVTAVEAGSKVPVPKNETASYQTNHPKPVDDGTAMTRVWSRLDQLEGEVAKLGKSLTATLDEIKTLVSPSSSSGATVPKAPTS